jgi:hypothetical protein
MGLHSNIGAKREAYIKRLVRTKNIHRWKQSGYTIERFAGGGVVTVTVTDSSGIDITEWEEPQ